MPLKKSVFGVNWSGNVLELCVFFDFCSVQNKENVGQMTSTSGGAGGGLRFKRFNLNR